VVETASCYPTEEQHDRWRDRAEDLGMTKSDFIASMVEAGIKAARGFEPGVGADETAADLREQRNELRDELEAARARVSELEDRVFGAERREAERFVRENPGATHSELVSHLQATVPGRMGRLTDGLVVDERPDGREGYYHPGDEGRQATEGGADFVAGTGLPARGDR
jgi:DNA-binding transcriptional ArsR family regulator